MEIIGKNIKKYRNNKKYTQEKLAELLNLSTVHIANVEIEKRTLSLKNLCKLCEILDITPNDILNETTILRSLETQIVNLFKTLNEEDLNLILSIAIYLKEKNNK